MLSCSTIVFIWTAVVFLMTFFDGSSFRVTQMPTVVGFHRTLTKLKVLSGLYIIVSHPIIMNMEHARETRTGFKTLYCGSARIPAFTAIEAINHNNESPCPPLITLRFLHYHSTPDSCCPMTSRSSPSVPPKNKLPSA